MANGTIASGRKAGDHSLGDIWSVVRGHSSDLSGLSVKIDALASNVGTLTGQMTTLAQAFTANQKVQWQPIITFAGVLLTGASIVGGLVAYGINSNISNNKNDVENLGRLFLEHISNGHPHSIIEKTTRNAADIIREANRAQKALDDMALSLRREMDLRDRAVAARLEALDKEAAK